MKKPTPAPAVKPGRKTTATPSQGKAQGPRSIVLLTQMVGVHREPKADIHEPYVEPEPILRHLRSTVAAYTASERAKQRTASRPETHGQLKLKATTLRLEPRLQAGLELLRGVLGVPVNKLVNEAVEGFIAQRSTELTRDLSGVLRQLMAYRTADPQFATANRRVLDAELKLLNKDPAEGEAYTVEDVLVEPGSATRLVKDLLTSPKR